MNINYSAILATDNKRGIGKDNSLPWRGSEAGKKDMKHFLDTTTGSGGNCVIFGRRTWESIPIKFRPMKNRLNVVVSSYNQEVETFKTLKEAVAYCYESKTKESGGKIFVCGGKGLYEEAFADLNCNEIITTHIEGDYDCDVFIPFHAAFGFVEDKEATIEMEDIQIYRFVRE